MSHISIKLAALVILLLPLAWTAAFAGLQRLISTQSAQMDDKTEKLNLLLLIVPVFAGVLFATLAPLAPVNVPLPVLPMVDFAEAPATVIAPQSAAAHPSLDWLRLAIPASLCLYGAVAIFRGLRLAMAQLHLARLVATALRDERVGTDVRLTPFAAPPLAWGRRTVLLPLSLVSAFTDNQVALIVRHEREHLRRGDSRWFAILAWVDVIFWFNPFIRAQTRRCRLAAELACDAAVLRATPDMRSLYAQTLVKTLKHTAGNALPISTQSGVPAVFSPEKSGDYRMRISEIMHPPGTRRKSSRGWLYAAAAILAIPVAFAQFAWSQGTPVASAAAAATAASDAKPHLTALPIDVPMSSPFGDRISPVDGKKQFHSGVDFAAAKGTPVRAAGDGTVSNVTIQSWGMGNVIEIDHGGGLKTRYAHLDKASVKAGDHVTAGQDIGTAGSSGISTGPHLHFEVWQDGQDIDPMTALPVAH